MRCFSHSRNQLKHKKAIKPFFMQQRGLLDLAVKDQHSAQELKKFSIKLPDAKFPPDDLQ